MIDKNVESNITESQSISINIAKLYCAFLVVIIHCLEIQINHPIGNVIVNCISQQAVPFFFIVTGFFLSKKIYSENQESIFNVIKKNILLYVSWVVLGTWNIITVYSHKYPGISTVKFCLLIFRRIVFAGYGVYWYLLITAEAVFVIAIICKKWLHLNDKVLYFMAIIFLAWALLYESNISIPFINIMNSAVTTVFSWSNNVFMKGFPFVVIGMFIDKYRERISYAFNKWCAIYLLATIANITLFSIIGTNYAFLYPIQSVSLFMMTITIPFMLKNKKCSVIMREMSSVIYFLHTVIIYCLIDPYLGIDCVLVLKFLIAVGVSILIYVIAKLTNIKFLNWMLNINK